MEHTYFVVESRNGKLSSSLCYERLPTQYQGKKAQENGLVYYRRIDDQPHLCNRSRDELFDIWHASGELPDKEAPTIDNEEAPTMDTPTDNDPYIIVAEISKNWRNGLGLDDRPPISTQFETVLNYNHNRGYHLIEWKYAATLTSNDSIVETIIAIFKKYSPSTDIRDI